MTDTSVPAQPEILLSAVLPGGGTSPWAFAALAARLGGHRPGVHAHSRAVLAGAHEQRHDLVRLRRRRRHDDPFRQRDVRRCRRCPGRCSPCSTGSAAARPATSPRTRSPTSRRGRRTGSLVSACTNPFPATGGADAETIAQVRDRAPSSSARSRCGSCRPRDYVAAAQSLPWVQQAGTTFRWTGSWLTALTSAEPGRQRAADDRPARGRSPSCSTGSGWPATRATSCPRATSRSTCRSRSCAAGTAFASDVRPPCSPRCSPARCPAGEPGFFDHSRWSFGQPLESSALLAAIQSCPGVVGVVPGPVPRARRPADWAPLPEHGDRRRRPDPARRQRPEPAGGRLAAGDGGGTK